MRQIVRAPWFGYAAAIVLSAGAIGLTQQTMLRARTPYLLSLLAVLILARAYGLGPGLVATVLTGIASYTISSSSASPFLFENFDELTRLGAFGLIASVACWLVAERRKSRHYAEITAQRQALLADLARSATTGQEPAALLATVGPGLAKSFNVERSAILQHPPDSSVLILRGGWGWDDELLGQSVIDADVDSPEAKALRAEGAETFSYSQKEKTTRLANFMINHKVRSGMCVGIRGEKGAPPFGVAGVYSTQPRRFDEGDLYFLNVFSDLLGKAIAHRATDERLRGKNEEQARTLASIADGVIVTDSQLALTLMNPAAEALTGWSQAEGTSQRVEDLFRVIDGKSEEPVPNPAACAVQNLQAAGLPPDGVLIRRDGARIAIDARAAPICDATGKLSGAVMTIRDVSAAREVERATRQSEERLRTALVCSPVVVFNQDLDLRYTWVNDARHGFPDSKVVGRTDADLMTRPDSARWSEVKRDVIESGVGTRVEISAAVEGQRRTFDLTVEPLRDREDKIVGVTCASIEITERKRDQAATARLAAIVESSEDAIVGKTLDGIILSWNPGAERLYQYEPDEIIGKSVAVLYPPDRMDEFRQITEKLKRGEAVPPHDTERVRKDGSRIDMSVSISLVRDGLGRVVGASSIARDITQRKMLLEENKRLVEELQTANEELEKRVAQRTNQLQAANKELEREIGERRQANEQLRQLSAHLQSAREEERTRVAREIHDELGQVLTVVKMDLSLLEQNLAERGNKNLGNDLANQMHATSKLVDESIQKMRRIIQELRPGILDHLGLLAAIEWQAKEFQAHTGIECHLDAKEDEIKLDLDRTTAVFRIFQETLTNIARHAHATRVDIRLEKTDHVTLEVQDNGVGIAQSELPNEKTFGILGMRERALEFGGEVEVHGEAGRGTTVRVRIPLEQAHD